MLFREPEPLPAPTTYEIIDALEAARQVLTVGGDLAKGISATRVNGRLCYCIVAAITVSCRTKQIRDAAMDCTRRALPGRFWQSSIEAYNDAKQTTVEDAKTLLQRAKSNVGTVAA